MSNVEAADAVDTEAVEAVASEEAAEEGDEVQPEESTQQVEEPAEKVVVEAEGAEQLATVLSVDTREEDEGGEAIAASEPILPSSSGPSDQPAAPPSLAYGSIHHWCPRCIRQQQLPDCTASDDPLALTWSEQAFFACGASHLSSLIDAPGFLPPPTSLPPFVPTTIAIVGPPLSGRTTLALQLASTYNLAYISLPSLLTSLTSPTHPLHSTLPTLPHPAPLPVLLSLLSHAITTAAASGLSGYVLDSWPSTVEVWRAMEERGMGVRRVIRTVAGLRVEEEVALVEVKTKVRQDTLDAEQAKRQRMKAASAAAAALIEARRLSQAAGDADLQGGGKEAAAEDAQVSLEATLEAAASAEDTAAAETDEPSTSAADKSAPPVVSAEEDAKVNPASTTLLPSAQGSDVRVKVVINADDTVSVVVIDLAADAYEQASAVARLTALIESVSTSLGGAEWRARFDSFAALLVALREQRLLTALTRSGNPAAALSEAKALLTVLSSSHLAYLTAAASSLGFDVTSLPLPSSYLQALPAPFRSLCPVCFHSGRPLKPLPLTSTLLLHRSSLYRVCDASESSALLADPARYTDASTFPAEVATVWQGEDNEVWGDEYCPVSVRGVKEGTRGWLLQGADQFSALYRGRVYRCSSEDALKAFLAAPAEFSELQLPSPAPLPPLPPPSSNELLRAGQILPFLTQTFRAVLEASLTKLSQHRTSLLYPALSVPQSAQLLLALALRNDNAAIAAFLDDCSLIAAVKQHYDAPTPPDTPTPLTARYDTLQTTLRGAEAERIKAHFDARFFHSA